MRVVVRLAGGLGNQLFQYAAGRSIALAAGGRVELDRSSFASDPLRRRFALGRFPIHAAERDLDGWRRRVVDLPGIWRLARATGAWPSLGGTRFAFDRLRGFDPRIATRAETLVLTGYWQDEAYFAAAGETLAGELDPSASFPDATRRLGSELASAATLAVHVRRSDFTDPKSPHGSCSPAYHRAAVAWIRSQTALDRIFVFSDDVAWAKNSLHLDAAFETLERDPARGDDEELWLMSRCRHLVIANSSFSWWAAWLAERRAGGTGTLVACPARWYRPAAGPIPHPAPPRWRRIADPDSPA